MIHRWLITGERFGFDWSLYSIVRVQWIIVPCLMNDCSVCNELLFYDHLLCAPKRGWSFFPSTETRLTRLARRFSHATQMSLWNSYAPLHCDDHRDTVTMKGVTLLWGEWSAMHQRDHDKWSVQTNQRITVITVGCLEGRCRYEQRDNSRCRTNVDMSAIMWISINRRTMRIIWTCHLC